MKLPRWYLLLVVAITGCALDTPTDPTAATTAELPAFAVNTSGMTVTVLPTLGGRSEAFAINNAGVAVGSSIEANGYTRAVVWTRVDGIWEIRTINPDPPATTSRALGINEAGTVVGDADGRRTAMVWYTDGSRTALGPGRASAINATGVIAGISHVGPGSERAGPAAWTPTGSPYTIHHLELPPGVVPGSCFPGEALSLNDANVIVGFVNDGACAQLPVLWLPRTDGAGWLPAERLSPVGTLAAGVAHAIDGSTVVGMAWPCATVAACTRNAFRWIIGGAAGPLGSLDAQANGLNADGYVVGSYIAKGGRMTAFVKSPLTSTFTSLPSLKSSGDYWAWDINAGSLRQAVGVVRSSNTTEASAVVWTIP